MKESDKNFSKCLDDANSTLIMLWYQINMKCICSDTKLMWNVYECSKNQW